MHFYKFQANGNDFIIVDDRQGLFIEQTKKIASLCHRHFGIGADGLILLKDSVDSDFDMCYFNSDGKPAAMCGNGGRCIAALAFMKNIAGKKMLFSATDGIHEAQIENVSSDKKIFDVSLKMQDVEGVKVFDDGWFLNTGVPHFVRFVSHVKRLDVTLLGRKIRNDDRFLPQGTNVNFVEIQKDRLFVRTYERGVEDETLSCGTGVTASALATFAKTGKSPSEIITSGGTFSVRFQKVKNGFNHVWLRGPAQWVFEGDIIFSNFSTHP